MTITGATVVTKHTVQLEVTDQPTFRPQYGHEDKDAQPDTLTLEWYRYPDQNGGAWRASQVTVAGPVLKRDGTPGSQRGSRRWWLSGQVPLRPDSTPPAWITEAVERYAPAPWSETAREEIPYVDRAGRVHQL